MTKKTLLVLGLLLIGTSSLAPEIFYPWKDTFIGSLDGPGWPGLVIAPAKDCAFAFLLRVERVGEAAEGGDFYYLVSQVGPHSPDGLYARVKFDLGLPFKMGKDTPILLKPPSRKLILTVEWSRRDEKTVIGRILCPEGVRVTIVHYFPWDLKGEYALLADGQVQGRCGAPGNPSYLIWTSRPGEPASAPAGGLALSYLPDADRTIAFVAGVGGDAQAVGNRITRYKNAETPTPVCPRRLPTACIGRSFTRREATVFTRRPAGPGSSPGRKVAGTTGRSSARIPCSTPWGSSSKARNWPSTLSGPSWKLSTRTGTCRIGGAVSGAPQTAPSLPSGRSSS
jgi:hypothetical protein